MEKFEFRDVLNFAAFIIMLMRLIYKISHQRVE